MMAGKSARWYRGTELQKVSDTAMSHTRVQYRAIERGNLASILAIATTAKPSSPATISRMNMERLVGSVAVAAVAHVARSPSHGHAGASPNDGSDSACARARTSPLRTAV